ncbi:MAG: hypothetical protein ACRCX8_13835 [Sarcina sp.]
MSNISNKIKPKITKVINKFPTNVRVYRDSLNEFNEPLDKQFVCDITGFYHEGNSTISAITQDKGEIKRSKQMFLMVAYDDISVNINADDYFFLDNVKYRIKDKGNQNRLNIYFDMLLEVN